LLKHNGFEVHYFNCLQRPLHSKQKYGNTGDFEHREFPKPELYRSIKRKYKIYGRPHEALKSFLSFAARPHLICLGSGMTYWLPGLIETAKVIREIFPHIPLVIGGVSAKLIPTHIKEALAGAHCFIGSLFSQDSLNNCTIPLLSTLHATSWEPSFTDAYRHFSFSHHGPVLSSLGCPMACSYCASSFLQDKFTIRNPRVVADEINYLNSRFNIEHYAFFDDAMLHDPTNNFLPLMAAISARKLNVTFHTPNGLHARLLSPKIIDIMKQAGFATLRFGYESGDPRYGRDTNAKASRRELEQKIKMTLKGGFDKASIGVYVMAGLSGQSPDDVLREMESIASLSVKVKPVFLSPVPQTRLFSLYAPDYPDLDKDPLWHNDTFFVSRLPGWGAESMQAVVDAARKHNALIDTEH
jgi:hypothetical protein